MLTTYDGSTNVMISYSNKNEDVGLVLDQELEKRGISKWRWGPDATYSATMWNEIKEKQKDAKKIIVVLSKESIHSEPVMEEIEYGLQREDEEGTTILYFIYLNGCIFSDSWKYKEIIQDRNLFKWDVDKLDRFFTDLATTGYPLMIETPIEITT